MIEKIITSKLVSRRPGFTEKSLSDFPQHVYKFKDKNTLIENHCFYYTVIDPKWFFEDITQIQLVSLSALKLHWSQFKDKPYTLSSKPLTIPVSVIEGAVEYLNFKRQNKKK